MSDGQRDQVIATLRTQASELRALGASYLLLFESVVRDEASPESDANLFMEYDNTKFNLIDPLTLKYRLEDVLHRPAALMTRGSQHPRLRRDIERSAVQVF